MHSTNTKFGGEFQVHKWLRGWSSITKLWFKMAAAAILDFCTNINNSAADWHRRM